MEGKQVSLVTNTTDLLITLNRTFPKSPTASKTIELSISEWLLVAAFTAILIVGLVGNSLVIYVFGYRRKSIGRTTTEWLILHLGIIDLFSTVFNSTLYLYWTVTKHLRWDFGHVACKIFPAIGPILTTASSGVILIFAIDRYVAIVRPFRGELSIPTAAAAFVINIILSALSYTHYIYMIDLKSGRCISPPVNNLAYGIPNCTLIILRLLVFAVVFVYTSIQIFLTLRRNEKSASFKSRAPCNKRKDKRDKTKLRQSQNIARVLFTVGTVFIILVFPRELFYLIFNMSWITSKGGIGFSQLLLHTNSWLKVMHTANCCANIFIYAHMHSRFRRITLKFIYCCGAFKDELSGVMVSRYNSIRSGNEKSTDQSTKTHDETSCV